MSSLDAIRDALHFASRGVNLLQNDAGRELLRAAARELEEVEKLSIVSLSSGINRMREDQVAHDARRAALDQCRPYMQHSSKPPCPAHWDGRCFCGLSALLEE